MSIASRRRVPFWLLYPAWILLCVVLFLLLRGQPDPSRPTGRMGRAEAGERAVAFLKERDPGRFAGYEPVHTAHSPAGELGGEARWVVLCDRRAGDRLKHAVVVEMRASDGQLLRIRRPTLE